MADNSYVQSETIAITLGTIFAGAIAGVVTWFRKRLSCQDVVAARSLRQSHAMILLAQRLDEITERLHRGEKSNLAQQIDAALRDEFDNL